MAWGVVVLIALGGALVALASFRTGRGDRHQDRAAEAVGAFEGLVADIELEHQRVRGRVVSVVDLKPLRDLQPKAELSPDRLPRPLQLCARELESSLAKYLAVAGPAPTGSSAEEREARVEQRTYVDQDLKRAFAAAYGALTAYKTRRKG